MNVKQAEQAIGDTRETKKKVEVEIIEKRS